MMPEDEMTLDLGESLRNGCLGSEAERFEAVEIVNLVELLTHSSSPSLLRPILLELHSLSVVTRDLDTVLDALAAPLGAALGLHHKTLGLLGILDVGTKSSPPWSVEQQVIVLRMLGQPGRQDHL